MAKTRFGTQGQVSFRDLNEYYYVLGFLANSNNAELRWENNEDQGAWGSEGRIHCLIPEERFPLKTYLQYWKLFQKNTGMHLRRVTERKSQLILHIKKKVYRSKKIRGADSRRKEK